MIGISLVGEKYKWDMLDLLPGKWIGILLVEITQLLRHQPT